jgi:hypothetical protein
MSVSRRQFVQGAGVAGLGLLAGCTGLAPGAAALRASAVARAASLYAPTWRPTALLGVADSLLQAVVARYVPP